MRPPFCPLNKTTQKYSFETLKKLSSTDIEWISNYNLVKSKHITQIIKNNPEQYRIIKVSTNAVPILYYLLEIIPIDINEIYTQKQNLWGKISAHLLSWHKFNIAHPTYSVLYDFDFCVYNPEFVDDNLKVSLIAQSLDKIACKLDINIVTLTGNTNMSPFTLATIEKLGFEQPIQDFTMELILSKEWFHFDDYLASLKRKYLKRAQNIRQKANELNFVKLSLEAIKHNADLINKLYLQVLQSQKFIAGTAHIDHFSQLKEIYNEQFELEGIYHNNNLIGFISYFNFNNELCIHYIGLDYSQNETFDIYFNILFRTIELGISLKKNTINYGRTSLDAKASLGANPSFKNTYMKTFGITKLIKNQIIKQLESLESNSWKTRKPFKTDISVLEEA